MASYFFMTLLAKLLTCETDLEQQSFALLASAALEQWFSCFFMALPAKTLTFETDLEQQSFTFVASAALEQWFPTCS